VGSGNFKDKNLNEYWLQQSTMGQQLNTEMQNLARFEKHVNSSLVCCISSVLTAKVNQGGIFSLVQSF